MHDEVGTCAEMFPLHFISFSLSFSFLSFFFILGSTGYKHNHGSFLFSFVNTSGVAPTKMKLNGSSNQNGIYCNSSYGPAFGGGHDFCISSNSNANTNSYSNLGSTYECPPNVTGTAFLAGGYNFYVHELEVFVYQSDLA